MFKNRSIRGKITGTMLSILILSQLLLNLFGYFNLLYINEFTDNTINQFGNESSEKSKDSLEKQAKYYLNKLSIELSNLSNHILKKISGQVEGVAVGMSLISGDPCIYQSKNVSYDMNHYFDSKESVDLRLFAVDPSSSNDDGSFAIAYNNGLYPDTYSTTIDKWNSLTEKEKQNIDKQKNIVSETTIPQELNSQMMSLSKSRLIMQPVYTYSEEVDSIYFGTKNGIVGRYCMYPIERFYDPTKRNWYKDALNKFEKGEDGVCWQPAYISASNQSVCITCSKAFSDSDGNFSGVVAVDMYYDSIAGEILNMKIGESGHAFVIDQDANLIIDHSYKDSTSINNKNLLNEQIDDSFRSAIDKMTNMQSSVEEVKMDGQDYFLIFSPISVIGCSLGIIVNRDEIIEPAVEVNQSINEGLDKTKYDIDLKCLYGLILLIIIGLVFSALSTIVSIILSRKISQPILQLADTVSNVGKEGLPQPIKIKSKDEIGTLSLAFNQMTDSIKQYVLDLAKAIEDEQKIHSELNVAKKIQASMLPSIFPAFPNRDDFDVYATMEPAKEVGGDLYDFFFTDENNLAILIADVSGKGVAAALFMVIAKTLLKNELQKKIPVNEALNNVNKKLCDNNSQEMFVTAFVAVFNIKTGELKFSNAGHNHPLIYRKRDNKTDWLKMKRGFVLAGLETTKYELQNTFLDEGDILYLYTDGVTEATNRENKLFSDDRLFNIMNDPKISELSLKDILKYVRNEIDLFVNGADQADDITMLVFKNKTIDIDDDKY